MAFDPHHVANEIRALREEHGSDTTNIDANKEAYIAHGLHLALYNAPLLSEPVEAWQYGPVVPRIYHAAKVYGYGAIEPLGDGRRVLAYGDTLAVRAANVLRTVVSHYNGYSASALIKLTHKRGSPWDQVTNGGQDLRRGMTIPDGVIREHYLRMLGRRG